MRAFREWLPAHSWEARFPLGGSFATADIEDHYVTPNDLGLGRVVKFDHDFIGRDALEEIAQRPPRTKVALIRAHEDVMRILESQFQDGIPFAGSDHHTVDDAGEPRTEDFRISEAPVAADTLPKRGSRLSSPPTTSQGRICRRSRGDLEMSA